MNNENHLTAIGNPNASDEMTARPDDLAAVYTSLAGIEEEDTFAKAVNGKYKPPHIQIKSKLLQLPSTGSPDLYPPYQKR